VTAVARWDEQILQDSKDGKLDKIAAKTRAEHKDKFVS
jgi:hypothetical protein